MVKLETTAQENILQAANQLIANNTQRIDKSPHAESVSRFITKPTMKSLKLSLWYINSAP